MFIIRFIVFIAGFLSFPVLAVPFQLSLDGVDLTDPSVTVNAPTVAVTGQTGQPIILNQTLFATGMPLSEFFLDALNLSEVNNEYGSTDQKIFVLDEQLIQLEGNTIGSIVSVLRLYTQASVVDDTLIGLWTWVLQQEIALQSSIENFEIELLGTNGSWHTPVTTPMFNPSDDIFAGGIASDHIDFIFPDDGSIQPTISSELTLSLLITHTTSVPEPTAFALLFVGIIGILLRSVRFKKRLP